MREGARAALPGSIRFLAQNGVAFVEDLHDPELPPIWEDDEQVVSGSGSSVMLKVLHAVDGIVAFEFWEAAPHAVDEVPDLPAAMVFDGRIRAEHGMLRVRDVNGWNFLAVGAGRGIPPSGSTAMRQERLSGRLSCC